MKFIRPKDWITPQANMSDIGDACPVLAHVGTGLQLVTYPIAAAVSAVGAFLSRVEEKAK